MKKLIALAALMGIAVFSHSTHARSGSVSSPVQEIKFSQLAEQNLHNLSFDTKLALPVGTNDADLTALNKAPISGLGINAVNAAPACSIVPTPTAVSSWTVDNHVLSQDLAGKLGITWIGSGNAQTDKNTLVFVRQITKFASCNSTDGEWELRYGGYLRAVALVDDVDASAGFNFAIVAANATLKSRKVQVRVESVALSDPNLPVLASHAQDITVSGLTVENYQDFMRALNQAFDAAATSPLATMSLVAVTPLPGQNDRGIAHDLATTFALDRMAKGTDCESAVKQFESQFPNLGSGDTDQQIRATYRLVSGGCGSSGIQARTQADAYLNGNRFKK